MSVKGCIGQGSLGSGGRGLIQRELKEGLQHLFPERQIYLRQGGRVRFVSLSGRLQIVIAALLLLAAGWIAYTSTIYIFYEEIERENQRAQEAEFAYKTLLRRSRSEEGHIAALGDVVRRKAAVEEDLRSLKRQLQESETERTSLAAVRDELTRAFSDVKSELESVSGTNVSLMGDLRAVEQKLEEVTARTTTLVKERGGLQVRVGELEQRIDDFQDTQEGLLLRLGARINSNIQKAERVIAMTGLNADKLLADAVDGRLGKGGPFIPAAAPQLGDQIETQLAALEDTFSRWEALQRLLHVLPLTAPLNAYEVTSRFGKRRDPLTKRWAMHAGVDLSAQRKTAVLSPAPGVVTFVGWKGRYGKMVEINHGLGIRTRYGHLHRILVNHGQEVGFRHKIGLVGNTGRSVGSHLHYEILIRGVPHDPPRFIRAGKHLFKG